MSYSIQKMKFEDLSAVKQLLQSAELPFEDIDKHWNTFLVARNHDFIIGAIGLEMLEENALLRSLVVKEEFRNMGIGKELYNKCIELAEENNSNEIGLLTTTAEGFFKKRGFITLSKHEIPDFIQQTKEYKVYCPDSSTVMIKKLK